MSRNVIDRTADAGRTTPRAAGVVRATTPRVLALGSGLLLIGASLGVLYHVADVVGDTTSLVAVVVGAATLATALSRAVAVRTGVGIGAAIFVCGIGGYLVLLPDVYYALFTAERVYADVAALVTGQSVVVLLNAGLWAIAIAPGPTFLSWYLTLRRRYGFAAIVGGLTLGFFVLTGDAGPATTAAGMAGALGLLGFGSVDVRDGTWKQLADVGLVLSVAVVAARSIDLVPDRARASRGPGGGSSAPTLEASLLGSPEQVRIGGSISLSPAVRFTVWADEPAKWRVGAYDRYTGDGWVRTGGAEPYEGDLSAPVGDGRELRQRYRVESPVRTMPAAWKPVLVGGDDVAARVTAFGGLRPATTLAAGDTYTVVSLRPTWTPTALREAGTDYPAAVEERYLGLPDSTPGRVRRRAEAIAADADTPYDAAVAIRDWLRSEKEYSLRARRSGWDAADAFVFEMDRGYCVHFATAMAVLLRAIGVPARFVVGYTAGERAETDRWVVRGLDSHAWVEAYVPGVGWVAFDPTPVEPREALARRRIERARASGDAGTETSTDASTETPTPTERASAPPTTDRSPSPDAGDAGSDPGSTATGGPATLPGAIGGGAGGGVDRTPFPATAIGGMADRPAGESSAWSDGIGRSRLSLLAGAAGLVIGAYRIGAFQRLHRSVRLRHQRPTGMPETDMNRAFERLEYLLSRRHRERRADETPRQYLAAIGADRNERVRRVGELYERVRYSGRATRGDAKEAIRLVDELVEDGGIE